MRRRLLRILLACLLVLIVAIAAIQFVLWSDWPRQRIERELQSQTGLHATIGAVDSGWFGRTVLRDVTLRLPLEHNPIAKLPQINLSHVSLIPMLLGADLDVERVELVEPTIDIYQKVDGTWNLASAIDVVRHRQQAPDPSGPQSAIDLPAISVRDATISLATAGNYPVKLENVSFNGSPGGGSVWRFEADWPERLHVDGELTPLGQWAHRLEIQAGDTSRVVALFFPDAPPVTGWRLSWEGDIRDRGLAGDLDVDEVRIGDYSGGGRLSMSVRGEGVDLSGIRASAQAGDRRVRVSGGTIQLRPETVDVDRLRISAHDTQAMVSGRWNLALRQGEASLEWAGHLDQHSVHHRGTASASLTIAALGQVSMQLAATGHAESSAGDGEACISLQASGPDWRELRSEIRFERLVWQPAPEASNGDAPLAPPAEARAVPDLSGAIAAIQLRWPRIELARLSIPDAAGSASGHYDASRGDWSLHANLDQWAAPWLWPNPVTVSLAAFGSPDLAHLESFRLTATGLEASGDATFDAANEPALLGRAALRVAVARAREDASDRRGMLELDAALRGSVQPLRLAFEGSLQGRDLPLGDGELESISLPVSGDVVKQKLSFQSGAGAALGGEFDLVGEYNPAAQALRAAVSARDISLEQLLRALGRPLQADGALSARVNIVAPIDRLAATTASGEWQLANARALDQTIERGAGRIRLDRASLFVSDLRLQQGGGEITGQARVDLQTRQLALQLAGQRWPLHFPNAAAHAVVDAGVDLDIDVPQRSARGRISVAGPVTYDSQEIGAIDIQAEAQGRTVAVRSLSASAFGGAIDGAGTLALDDWRRSQGELRWADLNLESIAGLWLQASPISGRSAGSVALKPATDPRAPEPMRVDVRVHQTGVRLRNIELGEASIVGFIGPSRILIDNSRWHVAGGDVNLWSRLTWHGDEPFAHVHATLDALDVNQLALAANPESGEIAGLISGQLSAGGYLRRPRRMFGEARLSIAQSDLANDPAIGLIYGALNLDFGKRKPEGSGRALIRLEGDALDVVRFEHFNRGADIVARLRIEDVWRGGASPISGVAAGAVRPLKNLKIPFLEDFDRALEAFQSGAATVRINGTLGQREARVVPFAEISGALQRILTGSAD